MARSREGVGNGPRHSLTPNEIKEMLGLERHPTCGFVAAAYRSSLRIPAEALPEAYDEGDRPYASALYFLVTPEAQIVVHWIRSDQLYDHYLRSDMRPQLLIPGGTFHTSRLKAGAAGWALLASTEWPGVEPPDVEHGDIKALVEAYPNLRETIHSFTR